MKDLFDEIHPPLNTHQSLVEADRCYFCYDAPCMTACPTSIDVALFIRQIAKGNPKGAAKTILDQNIMGAMCARVCPTETLCEQACVRNTAEDKPVNIGLLQRHATDKLMQAGKSPFVRAATTGKKIAIVGAGPAGLSCAHALSLNGHEVTIFEARPKAGGLNEYGIAAYKANGDIAQKEVEFILSLGGIEIKCGEALGKDFSLEELRSDYDATFLALGMNAVNGLSLNTDDLSGLDNAVTTIEEIRQAKDASALDVGCNVVVIGGGMTAVDIAVQAKKLGAENVTMVYRRGVAAMSASPYEQQLAQTSGVKIIHHARPSALIGEKGAVRAVEFEGTEQTDQGLTGTGETFILEADRVYSAIGQTLDVSVLGSDLPDLAQGRFAVNDERRTSLRDVWAGGDCIAEGDDLTVIAVEDGKIAAASIHEFLQTSTAGKKA